MQYQQTFSQTFSLNNRPFLPTQYAYQWQRLYQASQCHTHYAIQLFSRTFSRKHQMWSLISNFLSLIQRRLGAQLKLVQRLSSNQVKLSTQELNTEPEQ